MPTAQYALHGQEYGQCCAIRGDIEDPWLRLADDVHAAASQ